MDFDPVNIALCRAGVLIGISIGLADKFQCNFGRNVKSLKLELSLVDNKIITVAMGSTGTYWQNLFIELINAGIKVVLTNGKFL